MDERNSRIKREKENSLRVHGNARKSPHSLGVTP